MSTREPGTVRQHLHHAHLHDETAGRDLATGARDLAAAVTARGLSRPERTSRARRAADAYADLDTILESVSIYADGRHSRMLDVLAATTSDAEVAGVWSGWLDGDAAAERIALDATARQLRAVRAFGFKSATSPEITPVAGLDFLASRAAGFLHSRVAMPVPFGDMFAKTNAPGAWTSIPAVSLDPAAGDPITRVEGLTNTTALGWHTSAGVMFASMQSVDFLDIGPELDRLVALAVDVTLEKALIADLATAAAAAASFNAAEVAVGVTGVGADMIVCHPADRPKVIATYSTANVHPSDRPQIVPAAGSTIGTALVMGTPAVYMAVTDAPKVDAIEVANFGVDLGYARAGQVRVRLAGAVQKVTVA